MKNYAGTNDKDDEIAAELEAAGIKVFWGEFFREAKGEVKTAVRGTLHGWTFERLWYYWSAQGPGLELAAANQLHKTHGDVVRVNGHCGAPSPKDQFDGLAVGFYHVDTAEGLKALADAIKGVVDRANAPEVPGLPPGALQAYSDAYKDAFTRANHLDAHVAGLKAALALSPKTSVPGNDAGMREALEDTQSLLALIHHIGPNREFWKDEGVAQQVTDQLTSNRRLLSAIATQPPKAETPAGVGDLRRKLSDLFQSQTGKPGGLFMDSAWPLIAAVLAPAVRAGDGVDEWMPIETAPRDGTYLLGCGPHETRGHYVDAIHFYLGRFTIEWMHGFGSPTHWRPLPAPPPALTAAPAANGEDA